MIARNFAGLRVLTPVLLISMIFFTGCTDGLSPLSSDDGSFESSAPGADKFRHAELLDRAVTKTAGKDGDEVALALVVGTQGTLGSQRVLERMKILERFKVIERFTFEAIFNGFAIAIVDEEGDGDFTTMLEQLVSDPDVLWFEPDFNVVNKPQAHSGVTSSQLVPWSVAMIGGMESSALSGNGSGSTDVDIYIVDTGVNKVDMNVVESRYFGDNGGNAHDDDGHGTHIAAIAAAQDDEDGLVGVAPGARIHNFRVLDNGYGDISVVLSAIEAIIEDYRANRRPTVVNMSIGEDIGTHVYTALDHAVEAAISEGIVIVVSAGNYGRNASNSTPAHVEEAITVGSFGMTGEFSSFSNFGPKIDILAPGEKVVSFDKDGSIVAMTGTSMAAAHVTGAAALYLADHPNASPADVQLALIASSKAVVSGVPSSTTNRMLWLGHDDDTPSIEADTADNMATPKTASDFFSSVNYSGGEGAWTSDWMESGESDGPSKGLIKVKGFGSGRCGSGNNCMALGSWFKRTEARSVTRSIDLSGPFNPTITFDYGVYRGRGRGQVDVKVSNDGGATWNTVKTYSFSNGGSGSESVSIAGYNTPGFQLRFELVPDHTGRVSGALFVDSIEINY